MGSKKLERSIRAGWSRNSLYVAYNTRALLADDESYSRLRLLVIIELGDRRNWSESSDK